MYLASLVEAVVGQPLQWQVGKCSVLLEQIPADQFGSRQVFVEWWE
jgi:hypothetical protein